MRPQCTCHHVVKRTTVHSTINPRCPLHGGVDYIILKFKLSEKDDKFPTRLTRDDGSTMIVGLHLKDKVHAIDCDMDEDCTCS